MTAALVVFILTYLVIAAGRVPWLSVDRPAAALLGAVMMVATGVLQPAEAGAAVNGDTLGLLASHWIPRLADPELLWLATALAATLAGNLTVVGSVANLIVLELAGPKGRVGFWRFLRSGAVVTGATLVVALAILLAERRLGWI